MDRDGLGRRIFQRDNKVGAVITLLPGLSGREHGSALRGPLLGRRQLFARFGRIPSALPMDEQVSRGVGT